MLLIDNELLFGSLTNLFILGWLALAIAAVIPLKVAVRRYLLIAGGRVAPLILCIAFVAGWSMTRGLPGDITSLQGVLTAYTVPERVLIAWVEILGLALLVARWMVDDASANHIPKPVLLIGLTATFFAAALGLVLYLASSRVWRTIAARS